MLLSPSAVAVVAAIAVVDVRRDGFKERKAAGGSRCTRCTFLCTSFFCTVRGLRNRYKLRHT